MFLSGFNYKKFQFFFSLRRPLRPVRDINAENGKAMSRSISLIRPGRCLPEAPRGGTSRCNLASLKPTQPPLRHCLPLHGRARGRSSTPKSSVNISGKLPRARVSSDYVHLPYVSAVDEAGRTRGDSGRMGAGRRITARTLITPASLGWP
ncbi:hypothetical protein PUN28_004924 [Cardiocondyla obscurior]|uniref:Uncharacterized protein n=1 Tax=Cardiocondyla obscurior TaxID=286306 RepID=A0AAW2GH19_9HYME